MKCEAAKVSVLSFRWKGNRPEPCYVRCYQPQKRQAKTRDWFQHETRITVKIPSTLNVVYVKPTRLRKMFNKNLPFLCSYTSDVTLSSVHRALKEEDSSLKCLFETARLKAMKTPPTNKETTNFSNPWFSEKVHARMNPLRAIRHKKTFSLQKQEEKTNNMNRHIIMTMMIRKYTTCKKIEVSKKALKLDL
ncbi:CLUMA_CG014967, isoform A [Clunio marinus]|uniref:CLUMA_CG014967, isoform A n=1 Tax=Clunio marinus TaxID=568069 RepID=A0A1J1IND7_9DIPT|nr:CLUMA_CG014967, isoform A [Clunio marinus]